MLPDRICKIPEGMRKVQMPSCTRPAYANSDNDGRRTNMLAATSSLITQYTQHTIRCDIGFADKK